MLFSRRDVVVGGIASGVATAITRQASAAVNNSSFFAGMLTDNGFSVPATNFAKIDPKWKKQVVKYKSSEPQGTVVVDTHQHFLYLIIENGTAIRYGVGVGKEGFKWYGRASVDRKTLWPRWTPPPEMLKRHPDLPAFVEGGSVKNPLGPRAMYLNRDGVDTGYRFHGTVEPWSIGHDASSGCIRMFNEYAIDLYQRIPVGTAVQVLPHIAEQAEEAERMVDDVSNL